MKLERWDERRDVEERKKDFNGRRGLGKDGEKGMDGTEGEKKREGGTVVNSKQLSFQTHIHTSCHKAITFLNGDLQHLHLLSESLLRLP